MSTLHEILQPKLQNLVKYVEECLKDADEDIQSVFLAKFQFLANNEDAFNKMLHESLLPNWKQDTETGVWALDVKAMEVEKEKVKKEAYEQIEKAASYYGASLIAPTLEAARRCLAYSFTPEQEAKIRLYFTMFCELSTNPPK